MNVRVDDASIAVDESGSGDAVVLLHGFPLTRAIWEAQFRTLSKTRRAIRLDLRGMGESSVTGGPYLMESLAGDVAAVLDSLGIERATLVGHSLGGYVALAFARMYSERVTNLALVCSRLDADAPARAKAREELADKIEAENSMQPVVDAYVPLLFAPETLEKRGQIVQRTLNVMRSNDPRGAAAMLRGMAVRAPADDIAEELTMPVLVVAGASDRATSIEEARATAEAFPSARLVTLERSGHLPMLEQPERLSALLAALA
jgi:pimeloyl-ACP methyl ester carboxylesterase